MTADQARAPHSAEFFGPERDYWWNEDCLQLIVGRLGLGTVRSVLDEGCGVGHSGRLISSLVAPEATISGVDRERAWVREAAAIAERAGLAGRFSYEQGIVEALPRRGYQLCRVKGFSLCPCHRSSEFSNARTEH